VTDGPIFKPNREQRRQVDGRLCAACIEPMAQADILGVRTDDAVLWMHDSCIGQLLANARKDDES
jgi:hypothetical protein